MQEVARCYARVLLAHEDPKDVRKDVHELKLNHQVVRYCFNDDERPGYPE